MNPSANKTLRLTFPQWQGGEIHNIAALVPELPPEDAAQGYYWGSQLLEWLAPAGDCSQAAVPVCLSLDEEDIRTENGIQAYAVLKRQLQAALAIIEVYQPERIVTLGGECSVSVPPFAYLAGKYRDDVAVVWLDAHRDLTVPTDSYNGYHAMALAKLLGTGDQAIIDMLPATVKPQDALIVGLRSVDEAVQRQIDLGVQSLVPAEVAADSRAVLDWLKQTGKSKVMVHLDLDVLDPAEFRIAVGKDPDGIRVADVVRIIRDIAGAADLVGLTIAEPMPQAVIKLKNLLAELPLLK
ncbi:MAG: arginase family protein [Neisseria sp.]|uniref:arginase family protein n=1 Tax=Neisseria sp. TaxID=192066 RepID=UPI0026DC0B43|nr:arginase family protein [Neisseria sp.]MDO4248652.1 arginase family protein [Neisseria sp.]